MSALVRTVKNDSGENERAYCVMVFRKGESKPLRYDAMIGSKALRCLRDFKRKKLRSFAVTISGPLHDPFEEILSADELAEVLLP